MNAQRCHPTRRPVLHSIAPACPHLLLLALLLTLASQWALPQARADVVYLHEATDLYQVESTNYPGLTSQWGQRTDFSRNVNEFTHGIGFKSESHTFSYQRYRYDGDNGLNRYEVAFDYWSVGVTNLTEHPWLDGYLTTGTNVYAAVSIESRWLPAGGQLDHLHQCFYSRLNQQ